MTGKLTYVVTDIAPKGDTVMVKLQCQRCKNQWDYKGKNAYYAPCSQCKTSVKVPREKKTKQ